MVDTRVDRNTWMNEQANKQMETCTPAAHANAGATKIQSTLVILNSKGLSEILRDIVSRHIRFAELKKK